MSLSRILIFLGVVGTVASLLHYYVWARLIRDPALPAPWGRVATVALVGLALLSFASLAMRRISNAAWTEHLTLVGITWLGVVFLLFIFTLGGDVIRGAVSLAQREAFDPQRREFFSRAMAGVVAAGAASMSAYGIVSAVSKVGVKRVRVKLSKLSSALNGYSIVQWSDVHIGGATIDVDFIRDLVERTNALSPDAVVITGDLVDGSVEDLSPIAGELRNLRARDGVFFVTGNHEYYSGAKSWIEYLSSLGIRVLRNERVRVRGEEGFDLAGVDDWTASQFYDDHGHDMRRIAEGRDTSKALVLLAHQPKALLDAAQHGVDLQLSGHTHGGQIFPFNFLVRLQQPFVAGLYEHEQSQIYVSSGTGYWGPPMRVGAPAEITHITLQNA